MVGADAGSSLTYSNTTDQMRAFVVTSLGPWLRYIEAALSADVDLFPPESKTYAAFDMDALLRGDPKSRGEIYTAGLSERGWLRRDEVRRFENLPAEENEPEPPAPEQPQQTEPEKQMEAVPNA